MKVVLAKEIQKAYFRSGRVITEKKSQEKKEKKKKTFVEGLIWSEEKAHT